MVMSTQDLCDFISNDPVDLSVIDIGDLEHRVHSWVSLCAFTPNDLPHEPFVVGLLSYLLLSLDNYDVSRPNRQDGRRWSVGQW